MNKAIVTKSITTLIMLFFSIVMIVPFLWMISTSFKTPAEVFRYPIQWIPDHFNWSHHIKVWSGQGSFVPYYLNSLKVAVLSTIGAVSCPPWRPTALPGLNSRGAIRCSWSTCP